MGNILTINWSPIKIGAANLLKGGNELNYSEIRGNFLFFKTQRRKAEKHGKIGIIIPNNNES